MWLRQFVLCSTNLAEATKPCWGKSLQDSCKRKFSVGSVERSRIARRPLQIWCRCPVQSRPKRVASCQAFRSSCRTIVPNSCTSDGPAGAGWPKQSGGMKRMQEDTRGEVERNHSISLLTGNPPEELLNDNAYVVCIVIHQVMVFLRCKQAPPTGKFRIPLSLVEYVKKQDKKKWVEPNRVCWLGVSQPPFNWFYLWWGSLYIAQSWFVHPSPIQRQKVFLRKWAAQLPNPWVNYHFPNE